MGERPADVDALGPLKYWPYPGLPEIYFPYDNTPGYLSPLVAVQLQNPKCEYSTVTAKIFIEVQQK